MKYRLNNDKQNQTLDLDLFKLKYNITTALKISGVEDEKNTNAHNSEENEINLFPLIYLFTEMSQNEDFEIQNENFKLFNSDKLRVYNIY